MVYAGSLEINAKASRLVQALASRTRLNARVGIWDNGSVLITLLAVPAAKFAHKFSSPEYFAANTPETDAQAFS
jgi:TctA family transporter